MYSAPSLPWMVSFLGRCFDVMTCSWGAKAAMVTTGSPAMYVPGTASSRPCTARQILKCQRSICSTFPVGMGNWYDQVSQVPHVPGSELKVWHPLGWL